MLGGASCLWEEADVVDVQAFFDCVERLDRNNQFSLERLQTEIAKLFAAPDTAGENLQMMTIHKSKGLEFDTVILLGLGNATGGNDDKSIVLWEEVAIDSAQLDVENPHVLHGTQHQEVALLAAPMIPKGQHQEAEVSPYDYLNALEKERANNEDARILYVAVTRAERKLHLVGIATQNKKGEITPVKNTYLDMLWPTVAADYLAADLSKTQTQDNDEESIAHFVPKLVRLEKPQIPHILQTEAKTVQVQPSTRNQAPLETNRLDADVGILTHWYLEIIVQQGLALWTTTRLAQLDLAMQHWFKQQAYAEKEAIFAAKRVQQLLTTTLNSEQGRWVLASHQKAEAELEMTTVQLSETKNYIVDRTFVDEINGEEVRWIIDYKTVHFSQETNDAALRAIAELYRSQLTTYAALFVDEALPVKKAVFFVSLGKMVDIS